MIAQPQTILYDLPAIVRELVFPPSGKGLNPNRGDLRIASGAGGMFVPGDNAPYVISKVMGRDLHNESVPQMVATLKNAIIRGQYGSEAHLVAIDELSGIGAHGSAPLSFSKAMWILHEQHTPWGGTWASRVEIYVSPGAVQDFAQGRGKAWKEVMPALAMAGRLSLEMYTGNGRTGSAHNTAGFPATIWRKAPKAFLALLKQYEGKPNKVHFVFTGTTKPPGAPKIWGGAMNTSWELAKSTPVGQEILANGPDEWKLGNQALTWLGEYNHYFR